MKVITIQNTLQVVFGVLDGDGDVVAKHPLTLEFNKINGTTWQDAVKKLAEAKEVLTKQLGEN